VVHAPAVAFVEFDGSTLREWARCGSSSLPEWFVRFSPPLIGLAACALAPEQRRAVGRSLERVRGRKGGVGHAVDVARTFSAYASCLAEVLGAGSPRGRLPEAVVHGELHVADAMAPFDGRTRGVVFATAHTGGWETAGPLLAREHGRRVMIAEQREGDAGARAIQDEARRAHGLLVAHVGLDPLAALPLARHLREGGVVALQIDRAPPGIRTRDVTLFGEAGRLPEGPLRLAMLTGSAVVPIFAARTGHRRYEVVAYPAVRVGRAAGAAELDAAAQHLADAMQDFVKRNPTQWFSFRD
jgi:lauroyl/myristoyl acyltransferase